MAAMKARTALRVGCGVVLQIVCAGTTAGDEAQPRAQQPGLEWLNWVLVDTSPQVNRERGAPWGTTNRAS